MVLKREGHAKFGKRGEKPKSGKGGGKKAFRPRMGEVKIQRRK